MSNNNSNRKKNIAESLCLGSLGTLQIMHSDKNVLNILFLGFIQSIC